MMLEGPPEKKVSLATSMPEREPDAQFTYSWNKDDGWTPTLEEAVEDASYYAKFTEKVNTYEVKFDTGEGGALNASGDESEGGTYEYGDEIKLVRKVDNQYFITTIDENGIHDEPYNSGQQLMHFITL